MLTRSKTRVVQIPKNTVDRNVKKVSTKKSKTVDKSIVHFADTTTNITIATTNDVNDNDTTTTTTTPTTTISNIQNENYVFKFTKISILLEHGFEETDLKKLKKAGFCTIEAIAYATRKELIKIKSHEIVCMEFKRATQIYKQRAAIKFITTGSKKLDGLLGGGIETGSLTEIFSEHRVLTSTFCENLAINCQQPTINGGHAKCVFIDTHGTFRTNNIIRIAQRRDLNAEECLENIAYVHVLNVDGLMKSLIDARALISEEKYSLLIINSIINHYRDFKMPEEACCRQNHLLKVFKVLHLIALEFNVAVLLVNEMVPSIENVKILIPAGGHTVSHATTTRLFFKNGHGNDKILQIYTSPHLAEAEASFSIANGEIGDV
uniref:RecA family profile 1 domain-containing protein n=1 Tax=Panagrolaimus davidi TaxID=227884 RepID=A0A914PBP9_9BILA